MRMSTAARKIIGPHCGKIYNEKRANGLRSVKIIINNPLPRHLKNLSEKLGVKPRFTFCKPSWSDEYIRTGIRFDYYPGVYE